VAGVVDEVRRSFGQSRALLVWERLVLPDGVSITLENAPATDARGYAGLEDRVDFHTLRLLRGIGLRPLLGVGTQLTFGGNGADLVRALRESSQANADRGGPRIAERYSTSSRPSALSVVKLARLPDRTPVKITIASHSSRTSRLPNMRTSIARHMISQSRFPS
jgi:hypothetical protein